MRRRSFDFIDIIPEEEAQQTLQPYFAILRQCIEEGVRAVEQREAEDPEFFHVYPAGARATLVFWQVVNRAETVFHRVEGASTSHNRGFLTVLIKDKLEIRFKKLNRSKRSRNYPTKHQKGYRFHLRLVGMEEPTRATAGYRLKPDGTVLDYLIVCERGHEVEWDIAIPVSQEAVVGRVETEAPVTKTPKVLPKKAE